MRDATEPPPAYEADVERANHNEQVEKLFVFMCVHWEEFQGLVYLCNATFFVYWHFLVHPQYKIKPELLSPS